MIVGSYVMHLYCDLESEDHGVDEFPHVYSGMNSRDCLSQVKKNGWMIVGGSPEITVCPKCVKGVDEKIIEREKIRMRKHGEE